ncbi:MAG: hypothetical protein ACREJG_01710, partial [Candidatus Rokuibacteriota bacterium]
VHNVVLDDLVFQTYAGHLLPRAIGYSAGLLEYFFRGRIEIAPPARYAYGLAAFLPGNAGTFTTLRFKVRNVTADEEQAGAGQMVAVVRHRRPLSGSLIDNPLAPLSSPFYAVSAPRAVTLTRDLQEVVFDFSASPLPTNAADLFLTVVYQGPLGLEEEAVMVGGKDLLEPDPIDRANITDYDCVGGTRYQVALGASILPPFDGTAHPERDVNGDGTQDLFGPWTESGVLLKTFDLGGPFPAISESNFDHHLPEFAYAQYGRVMVLQDARLYGVAVLRRRVTEFSTGTTALNVLETAAIPGVVNRIFQGPGGFLIQEFSLSGMYRGLSAYHILLLTTDGMRACLAGAGALTPALIKAPDVVAPDAGG